MAQHDYVVVNASGASFRADLNNALAAIVSFNSGPNQPNPTYAYQPWADTTTGELKLRNASNTAWIVLGILADVGLGLLSRAGGTMTGALLAAAGTAASPGLATAGDPDTGIYSKAANELGVAVAGALAAWFTADGLNLPAQDDVRFWDADSSNYVGLQAPATVATNRVWTLPATDGTAGQGLTTNGADVLGWSTLVEQGAAITAATVASINGLSSVDFNNIPSWVKRITVTFNGVSTNGTSAVQVQLGTAASFETTGYNSFSAAILPTNTVAVASLASGIATGFDTAASTRVGAITIHSTGSNGWAYTGLMADTSAGGNVQTAGVKGLAGALTRLRVTTTGADTFDSTNPLTIHYEG